MKGFFVSYTSADLAWAEWIAWQLEGAGYSVVLQAWDFTGNWVLEMDQAMRESARTIAVLSPRYLAARYTYPEWAEAFRRDPQGEQHLLTTVRIEAVTLTGILAAISYVDLVTRGTHAAPRCTLSASIPGFLQGARPLVLGDETA